jgi:hypothetical protein
MQVWIYNTNHYSDVRKSYILELIYAIFKIQIEICDVKNWKCMVSM